METAREDLGKRVEKLEEDLAQKIKEVQSKMEERIGPEDVTKIVKDEVQPFES